MKRRELITAAAALLVSPRRLRAQGTPRRIGLLTLNPISGALVKSLQELGWIEGENLLLIEYTVLPSFRIA
jgi:putative ABC transport system substrate-binding protein